MNPDIRERLITNSPALRRIWKTYFIATLLLCLSFISVNSSLDATRLTVLWPMGSVAIA